MMAGKYRFIKKDPIFNYSIEILKIGQGNYPMLLMLVEPLFQLTLQFWIVKSLGMTKTQKKFFRGPKPYLPNDIKFLFLISYR